jgi:hypothetical protein
MSSGRVARRPGRTEKARIRMGPRRVTMTKALLAAVRLNSKMDTLKSLFTAVRLSPDEL